MEEGQRMTPVVLRRNIIFLVFITVTMGSLGAFLEPLRAWCALSWGIAVIYVGWRFAELLVNAFRARHQAPTNQKEEEQVS